MNPDYFMDLALREAEKAAAQGDVPVGAVVVHQGVVIGRGRNQIEQLQDPTAHAEILALGAAAGHLNSWRLDGCTLFVTLEPCMMCLGAMLASRIAGLTFGTYDPRLGACGGWSNLAADNPYRHRIEISAGLRPEECSRQLKEFFVEMRKKETPKSKTRNPH
jgi:tRNA(adenine34) deaminase